MRWIKIAVMLLMCALLLACSNQAEGEKFGPASTLVVAIPGLPQSLDPTLSGEAYGWFFYTQIYAGLTRLDGDGNIVPVQATDWEISSDGMQYTFHLTKSLKWSNGEKLTAHDYAYAWKRLLDPDHVSNNSYLLNELILNAELPIEDPDFGIQALDDDTLQVHLTHPAPYFLSIVSLPALVPVPAGSTDTLGDAFVHPRDYVSNGPFRLDRVVEGETVEMVKNPYYFQADKVKMDRIVFKVMTDDEKNFNAFGKGDIDAVIEGRLSYVERLDPRMVYSRTNPGVIFYMFNTDKAPFSDPAFRKLLSMSIDRNELVQNVTRGGEKPLMSLIPSGIHVFGQDYRQAATRYELTPYYDAEALAQQVARVDPTFLNRKYILSFYENAKVEEVARFVASSWKKNLGLEIEFKSLPWNNYVDTLKKADYDIAAMGISPDYIHPFAYFGAFLSRNEWLLSQFSSMAYDTLYTNVSSRSEPKFSLMGMHDLEDMVMKENMIMPLYQKSNVFYVSARLKGWDENDLGLFYFGQSYRE